MYIFKRDTPSWIILIIDIVICLFSVILAFLLRFNFSIPPLALLELPKVVGIILTIRLISFLITKSYTGVIRYTSTDDTLRIFVVTASGSAIFVLVNVYTYYVYHHYFIIPFSIIIIDFLVTTFTMISMRILVKLAYAEYLNPNRNKTNVVIFGAGEAGVIAKEALDRDAGSKYKVIAFFDDNVKKQGKKLINIPIYEADKITEILSTNTIAHMILAAQNISTARKQELIEICLANNTKVLTIPPVSSWINGELSFKQIKKVKINDLLERDVINLDKHKISADLAEKVILITGACGSIGSEMVRQIAAFPHKQIIVIDQAESALYNLEVELGEKYKTAHFEFILADIRNEARMRRIFKHFKPNIVFHVAAYKHVPVMEENPYEAITTNIFGTKLIADLSVETGVEKFVMVSTDKAVNPTNVMGASKRIAEVYVQSVSHKGITKFITTRFGNVLGSNGSVIPLFNEQIEKGGPVTITHPEVTRYFMTIPEACQLVLEAGSMGNGGEIYIFDMGDSVKIVDLAKKMIKLSNLTLGKDIQIIYTGLRPGEKLYEELLNNKENTIPTHHPKIMIAKVGDFDVERFNQLIQELKALIPLQDNFELVKKMKEIIPEYKSQNSVYEKLDV
ncbi:MAG: nucleoside-diphosphate sugar epimerase/dehydratase [Bacteroidetes bacterium]|nr:nucleoside-diphosphate sugar epimerase/dehydratase [Bacteroidota bacterium]